MMRLKHSELGVKTARRSPDEHGPLCRHLATEHLQCACWTQGTEFLIVFYFHQFKFKFIWLYVASSYCIDQCTPRTIQGGKTNQLTNKKTTQPRGWVTWWIMVLLSKIEKT